MNEQIVALLHKSINGVALTDTEKEELNNWINRSEHNRQLYNDVMNNPEAIRQEVRFMLNYNSKSLWKKIDRQLPVKKNIIVSFFRGRPIRYAAAAAVLIIAGLSAWFFFISDQRTTTNEQRITSNQPPSTADIPPGSDGAVLTLSDGKQIILDNTGKGEIAQEGNARVIKSEDGQLEYQLSGKNHPGGEARYNTVSTQRGKQYRIVLPDGSKVWLNAASSIRYPAIFTGKERRVTVTGELYFEIAKDKTKPFRVAITSSPQSGEERGEVEVLGTHFNVNAYEDESSVNTTLLEGLVKVSKGGKNSFLKPGQQARLSATKDIKVINDADIDQTIAWKNGVFSFNEDFETVMRQVARWYDVDIIFKDRFSYHAVATTIPRNVALSRLLHLLELTGRMHFSVDGKKITVYAGPKK